jgi:hypothetical protein
MPRRPTSEHDFSDRKLNPPIQERSMLRGAFYCGAPRRSHVIHRLPRLDSNDSLSAARTIAGWNKNGYLLPNLDSLRDVIQSRPVICELNWFEDFNHPQKHPFIRAQRQAFFIGEAEDLGDLLGSWHIVACGYHYARNKEEWIRFQNCWGHDYPLVWMPMKTISSLWQSGQFEASIAA